MQAAIVRGGETSRRGCHLGRCRPGVSLRRCGLWADADWIQLDRRGAELLFQVLTEREEKSAVAIASKEPFSGWTKTVTDPSLCAAVVDRLTFNGQIIETGHSCRLAHARRAKASN